MDELTDQNIALVQKVAILQEDIAEQDAVIKTLQERLKKYDAR